MTSKIGTKAQGAVLTPSFYSLGQTSEIIWFAWWKQLNNATKLGQFGSSI
jgi:hypothetical protein